MNAIKTLQDTLSKLITDWEKDQSMPANWERKTGMGEAVAVVDRRCGGYQNSHKPVMIGWKAELWDRGTGHCASGVVMVTAKLRTDAAIEKAKRQADEALSGLLKEHRGIDFNA